MDSRTFGRVTLTLPGLDEPGLHLSNVQSLDGGRGAVQDFQYADADLRMLDLADTQLLRGRVTDLRTGRASLDQLQLNSIEFSGCDFGSAQWRKSKLSRVAFRNCKIMGGALDALTLDDVLFENCKLDYTAFSGLRATGPVVFSQCVLTEASFTECDLTDAVFDGCTLRLTEFAKGRYKGLDLRGNDLSSLLGVARLSKVLIDRAQQFELAQALLTELDVTYGEDLDELR
ncbi:pentapeptide repeat-containing protein [Streptomyces sp. NPDC048696]|uniref:pentapeptide repeat-containing protein n=1 Tax=Streptomyces sp. NPDC048696 TaxID=3365585 RepID=UPI00371D78FD